MLPLCYYQGSEIVVKLNCFDFEGVQKSLEAHVEVRGPHFVPLHLLHFLMRDKIKHFSCFFFSCIYLFIYTEMHTI